MLLAIMAAKQPFFNQRCFALVSVPPHGANKPNCLRLIELFA
ncbi:hypothetical protein [Undibacterium sp. CCC1.1]